MSTKHEKWFWFALMLGSYALAAWVLTEWLIFRNPSANIFYLFGIGLICYFTTACFKSILFLDSKDE
jgi:hypothetical protein